LIWILGYVYPRARPDLGGPDGSDDPVTVVTSQAGDLGPPAEDRRSIELR